MYNQIIIDDLRIFHSCYAYAINFNGKNTVILHADKRAIPLEKAIKENDSLKIKEIVGIR